jgi:hypothetical protein
MIVGALAFIVTTLHVLLSMPVFLRIMVRNDTPRKRMLIYFFSSGICMYSLWLIYTWKVDNLFITVAIALMILAYIVFLFQSLWIKKQERKTRFDRF